MLTIPKTKIINDVTVKALKFKKEKDADLPIKGYDMFPEIYCMMYLLAHKKSGKSTTIVRIIENCAVKDLTKVYVFCSTIYDDKTYESLKDRLDKKGIENYFYDSIFDEEGDNRISTLIKLMSNHDDESDTDDEEDTSCRVMSWDDEIVVKVKKPRIRYRAPKYIIVLDDNSPELKDPQLTFLMKKNRHYKCKIIISNQYLNDLPPSSRNQIDYFLLWPDLPIKKLEQVYECSGVKIPFNSFVVLYNEATSKKYNFLYIDKNDYSFRKNFNEKYYFL